SEVVGETLRQTDKALFQNSQYKHYPKLISNLLAGANLKDIGATIELKNINNKLAELYYYIEEKLNEKRRTGVFIRKNRNVLVKADRFLHRVSFLKLSLVRRSIYTFLKELDTAHKCGDELYEVKEDIIEDIITFFEQERFIFNYRPASPISSISYHFGSGYNGIPVSIISDFADSLKKYAFFGLSPFDFRVKILEDYDTDGLVENIVYKFKIEQEVMKGFTKKLNLLLK
ncbi:MAG: hypothetical protein AAGH79_16355, partial [Bacteroidota bacterium]